VPQHTHSLKAVALLSIASIYLALIRWETSHVGFQAYLSGDADIQTAVAIDVLSLVAEWGIFQALCLGLLVDPF